MPKALRRGSLEDALRLAGAVPRVLVIGGAQIYALALPLATMLELTEIDAELEADTFFPAWDRAAFKEIAREPHVTAQGLRYAFVSYRRIDSPDREVDTLDVRARVPDPLSTAPGDLSPAPTPTQPQRRSPASISA